jgi:WD repeat-containing protein 48
MSPARRSFGGGGWSPGGGAGRGIDDRREDDALALRTAVIAGAPPAVAHAQLPDRRRVLARDAAGGMALWDVTAFKVVRRWPRLSVSEDGASAEASTSREGNASAVSFEARSAARFETTLEALKNELGPVSVPSWFAADNRSGSLAVTLSPSGAFQAEGYARELGARDASDETKVNFGVQTLHALLREWAKKRRVASNGARDPNGDVGEDVDVLVSDESKTNEKTFDVDKCGPCDDARLFATPNANDFSPTFFFEPPELPYDPTSAAAGPPGRAVVLMDGSSMLGTDVEEALLPEWVVDVAAERYKVPDAPKASFYIAEHPEEEGRESALASGKGTAITSGKVTAPRVLSVRKVCSYVVAKLGLDLSDDVAVEDAVEIFCDGKKLDPSWSLATVREHVWRRGDDLRVTFRVTEAVAKPAGE